MNESDVAIETWKDGPLYNNTNAAGWIRELDKKVLLNYISQNDIDELLNKV